MTSDDYCRSKVAPVGSSLYYSLLSLSTEQRSAFIALYALQQELAAIAVECQQISVALTKLQWWREEIPRLLVRQPRHPITQALAVHLDRFNLSPSYFQELLDGVAMHINCTVYRNFQELSLCCQGMRSSVSLLATEIQGYQDHRTLQFSRNLGIALQLMQLLRNVLPHARQGRCYIPEDELQYFQVSHTDLLNRQTPGRVQALFKFQAERALNYQRQAFEQLPERDRYLQLSHIVLAELNTRLLDEIEADGYRVLEQQIRLTPLRKFWIAWRVVRRERRRHLRIKTTD